MYNETKVAVFHSAVEPKASGTQILSSKEAGIDVDELHNALLNDGLYVVICNNVEKYTDVCIEQHFIISDKLPAEEDYEDTWVISHFGKVLTGATNRKNIISFKGTGASALMKVTFGV